MGVSVKPKSDIFIDMQINGIDIKGLKQDFKKNKFIELGYITEYPDITIIYINHNYTKGSNYIMIKDNGLADSVIKRLNTVMNKQGIDIFTTEYTSSCITQKLNAQPKGYKAI